VEHAGEVPQRASESDMRLQSELRRRAVDWLQLDQNAEHRVVGFSAAPLHFDEASGKHVAPPPPSAASVEVHRRSGTYAEAPQLRAIAEVLRCSIVSLDSRALYDRVPVHSCGSPHTLTLRSWRAQLAPTLARGESSHPDGPTIVIINNGVRGPCSHFDGTRRRVLHER
jgi:hypothetical protein